MNIQNYKKLIGQLFFISIPNTTIDNFTKKLLSAIQPGGIILFKNNIESIQQIQSLIKQTTSILQITPYIAIDEEGGRVHRLEKILPQIPSPLTLTSKANPSLAKKLHYSLALILKYLGINLNFYPVVDILYNNSIMAERCLSSNKNKIVQFTKKIIQAYQKAKLLYCFKHFPGLGKTTNDSHKTLPICDLTYSQLWNNDLYPYRKLITQIPFIMISHCYYNNLTKDNISSLSKNIITKLLKQKLKYRGQIITDDLSMKAITGNITIPEAALKAIKAGCHHIIICHSYNEIIQTWELISKQMQKNKTLKNIIEKNITKILNNKKKQRENLATYNMDTKELQKNINTLQKIHAQLIN